MIQRGSLRLLLVISFLAIFYQSSSAQSDIRGLALQPNPLVFDEPTLVGEMSTRILNLEVENGSGKASYEASVSISGDTSFSTPTPLYFEWNGAAPVIYFRPKHDRGYKETVTLIYTGHGTTNITTSSEIDAWGYKIYPRTYVFTDRDTLNFGNVPPGLMGELNARFYNPDSSSHYVVLKPTGNFAYPAMSHPPFSIYKPPLMGNFGFISANDYLSFQVRFRPTIAGFYKDSIRFYSSASMTIDTFTIYLIANSYDNNVNPLTLQYSTSLVPNPISTSATFSLTLLQSAFTSLKIYNSLGNEIAILSNQRLQAGDQRIEFDASHLPSGVYYYRLQIGDHIETKPIIIAH